jgi:hypothetical protein
MRIPDWIKPGVWGAVIGGIATMVVGFSYIGWSTAGTTDRIASERASTAVVTAMVPYCMAKAQQDADPTKLAKFKTETSSYSRNDLVRSAGWATLTGMNAPDSALAQACSEKMHGTAS